MAQAQTSQCFIAFESGVSFEVIFLNNSILELSRRAKNHSKKLDECVRCRLIWALACYQFLSLRNASE